MVRQDALVSGADHASVVPPVIRSRTLKLAALAAFFAPSCTPQPGNVLPPTELGFRVFETPRTFDGPGTVFRVDRDGVKYPVAVLDGVRIVSGEESVSSMEVRKKTTFAALLGYLGIGASIDAHNQINVRLKLTGTARHRTFDVDINPRVREFMNRYSTNLDSESRYYVVRETIAAQTIAWSVSTGVVREVNASIARTDSSMADGAIGASWNEDAEYQLQRHFVAPHNVFYKVELIDLQETTRGLAFIRLREIPDTTVALWSAERR